MKNLTNLTILHSNDLHGDFFAEQVDDKLIGGVSRLSGYISKTRAEIENTIYAIAGDMFRGSVIDSEFKGISTIEIMNLISPDVVTIGNHEVDYGVPHLLFIEKCAKFPIINANLHIKTTMSRLFSPYLIMEVDNLKVLFIGIITEDILNQTRGDDIVGTFLDIGEAAQDVGKICDTYNTMDIDLTVLLTHIGFENDKRLAAQLLPEWGVDIIIGGHSHTLPDKPELVNDILIVQAGVGTDQIGRFDLVVNTDTNTVDSYTWCTVPITDENCPRDIALEQIILGYKDVVDKKYGRVLNRLAEQATHPQRNIETSAGNLLCDILHDNLRVDLVMIGSGSIRTETFGPIVRLCDLLETFPYDDTMYLVKLNGAQIKHAISHILREESFTGETEFYQFSSGLKIKYSRSQAKLLECSLGGEPLDNEYHYKIALQGFHYANLKPFLDIDPSEMQDGSSRALTSSCLNVLEEGLSKGKFKHPKVEGRIEILP